jgi:GTP-binding protein
VRRKIARTSAAAGKTTFLNVYRVTIAGVPTTVRADGRPAGPGSTRHVQLIDLPGYGYARGGAKNAKAFDALTQEYFAGGGGSEDRPGPQAVVLAVDARHPGLASDLEAMTWLRELGIPTTVVATKVDQVGKSRWLQTRREFENALAHPVLLLSATVGEGLKPLWQSILGMLDGPPGTPSSDG